LEVEDGGGIERTYGCDVSLFEGVIVDAADYYRRGKKGREKIAMK
jgi:hypothetical protein